FLRGQERRADFSPLPAALGGPEGSELKPALLSSMAVYPTAPAASTGFLRMCVNNSANFCSAAIWFLRGFSAPRGLKGWRRCDERARGSLHRVSERPLNSASRMAIGS